MKKLLLTSLVLLTANAWALDLSTPTKVDSTFHTGYIPDGYDTNDHVQVVGEGIFSNSCYRPATYSVKVDQEDKTIQVKPKAYLYDGMCLQVLVPYSQTINVGLLKVGSYDVVQGDEHDNLGEMRVRAATNSDPDDFMYAPVDQAYLDSSDGDHTLALSGSFSNSCVSMVDVRIDVQPKVIVVQPITELEERDDCRSGSYPFEERVSLDRSVESGRYLLHIRSLNGKAVNNLVDIK